MIGQNHSVESAEPLEVSHYATADLLAVNIDLRQEILDSVAQQIARKIDADVMSLLMRGAGIGA